MVAPGGSSSTSPPGGCGLLRLCFGGRPGPRPGPRREAEAAGGPGGLGRARAAAGPGAGAEEQALREEPGATEAGLDEDAEGLHKQEEEAHAGPRGGGGGGGAAALRPPLRPLNGAEGPGAASSPPPDSKLPGRPDKENAANAPGPGPGGGGRYAELELRPVRINRTPWEERLEAALAQEELRLRELRARRARREWVV